MHLLPLLLFLAPQGAPRVQPPAPLVPRLTFIDRAPEAGVTSLGHGKGAGMVDLDQDGLLDLVVANSGMRNSIYRQLPDHTFEEVSQAWGLQPESRQTFVVLVADFDNDGDPDVYFVNGGWSGPESNQMLRNDLSTSGLLVDVSAGSKDADRMGQDFGGTTLDYNRDGLLDIFLSQKPSTCTLLRNDGGLVFTDVSASAGLTQTGDQRHCSTGDFDNDGWIDVGVGNFSGPCRLYRNNQDGTFTDYAPSSGIATPSSGNPGNNAYVGVVFEDFDNDGWMDLYLAKSVFGSAATPSPLMINNRDGTFTDVTTESLMPLSQDMGHNMSDVDGDGYPEVFSGTGSPAVGSSDALFRIVPGTTTPLVVTDITKSSGIDVGGPTRCHGMVFGDYDQDGDPDIYVNNGGPSTTIGSEEVNYLWQNQGTGNNWVAVELIGTMSNRSAVGARSIAVTSSGREVHRYLGVGKGFGNTSSPIQHFGLGKDDSLDRIDIRWPNGIQQTISNPNVNEKITVIESGIALVGSPGGGGALRVAVYGPPLEDVQLSLQPLPGVESAAGLPAAASLELVLDEEGRAFVPVAVPQGGLSGRADIRVQAQIGTTLSNVLMIQTPDRG